MRFLIFILILGTAVVSSSSDSSVDEGIRDAFAVIQRHRKLLQEKIVYTELTPETNSAKNQTMNNLAVAIDSIINGTRGHEDNKLARSFIGGLVGGTFNKALFNIHSNILSDTISVKFLSNLLRCNDEELSTWVHQILYEKTSFDILRTLNDHIKNNIRRSPHNKRLFHGPLYNLFSLLELTEAEKDSLMKTSLPLYIKANTGVKWALDSLISQYKNEKDDNKKRRLACQLMGTGKERALAAVLEDFNKPLFAIKYENTPYACTTSIIKHSVMRCLARYYPYEPLFTKEYSKVRSYDFRDPAAQAQLLEYWEKLADWFLKNYNIKIESTPPYRNVFNSGCYNSAFRLPEKYRKKK